MDEFKAQLNLPDLTQHTWRSRVLENSQAIKMLHDSTYRNLIRFFMSQSNTIQAAAKHLGQSVQGTFNRVVRLEQQGFLEVIAEQPRAGKAIKVYRTTADDYFVPFAATNASGYAELIESELRPLQKRLLQSLEHHLAHEDALEWGFRLVRDPDGGTHLLFTPKEDWQGFDCLDAMLAEKAAAVVNFWGIVPLSKTQGKAFQRELTALWSKYYLMSMQNTPETTTEPFIVGLSFVPEEY